MKYQILLLLLIICVYPLFAVLADYDFSYSEGAWQLLENGISLGNENTDDQNFIHPDYPAGLAGTQGMGLPIGFDFEYDGEIYDRFGINANGWISLGKSSEANTAVYMVWNSTDSPLQYCSSDPAWAGKINRISAFCRNLQAQPNSSLSYLTTGSFPSRKLVIQWLHFRRKNIDGDSFNFQIQLSESTNTISIVYGQMLCSSISAAAVGLRSAPADLATNFATRSTANGWANSSAGEDSAVLATLSGTNFPTSGACFTWQPALAPVANFRAVPQSGFAPLNVQFTDLSLANENPIVAWHWSFGDGGSSSFQNPVHSYMLPGIYDVSLTVTDASGKENIMLKNACIQAFAHSGASNCQLHIQGDDAVITWDAINTDSNGESFTPQYYFIYFNGSRDPAGEYYFLAATEYPINTYTHQNAGLGAKHMFYRVQAVAP